MRAWRGRAPSIFPDERATVWGKQVTGHVFRRFSGQLEREIPTGSNLYPQVLLTRDDSFRCCI